MIDWKRKLSSRKFWALLAAIIVACLTAFGQGTESIERIVGIVTAVGACAVYMLAEAKTDAQNKKNKAE